MTWTTRADELEQIEEEVIDQATASRTVHELAHRHPGSCSV